MAEREREKVKLRYANKKDISWKLEGDYHITKLGILIGDKWKLECQINEVEMVNLFLKKIIKNSILLNYSTKVRLCSSIYLMCTKVKAQYINNYTHCNE